MVQSCQNKSISLSVFQSCEGKSTLNDQIHWADGFIVVYDISDRSSFLTAKAILHLIRELHLGAAKRYPTRPHTGALLHTHWNHPEAQDKQGKMIVFGVVLPPVPFPLKVCQCNTMKMDWLKKSFNNDTTEKLYGISLWC